MGNRGCLHDDSGAIVRHHSGKRWIYCLLSFKDRRRDLMVPGHYTELFFLDEVTALAAGHRPCAECQRERFREFTDAWLAGNQHREVGSKLSATELDAQLHADRQIGRAGKRTFRARIGDLPDGTFVMLPDTGTVISSALLWNGRLRRWSPSGYARGQRPDPTLRYEVLTPPSTVRALPRFSAGAAI